MFTRLTGQLYFLDIAKIHMLMIRLVCLTNVFDQNTIFGMLMNLVLNFKNDDTHQFAKVASSKKNANHIFLEDCVVIFDTPLGPQLSFANVCEHRY